MLCGPKAECERARGRARVPGERAGTSERWWWRWWPWWWRWWRAGPCSLPAARPSVCGSTVPHSHAPDPLPPPQTLPSHSPPPRPARQLRDLIRDSLLPHLRDQNKCQQVSAAASVPILRAASALCPVHTFPLECQCSAIYTRAFLACAATSPTRPTGALSVKTPPALSAVRSVLPAATSSLEVPPALCDFVSA